MRARMAAAGFACMDAADAAAEPAFSPDVVVVNSCAVTAESERKTRQKLRRCRVRYPRCILVLTGCAAQICPDAAHAYPEADIVLGRSEIDDLPLCLDKFLLSHSKSYSASPLHPAESFALSDGSSRENFSRTRAFLKIEDGCDQFCSYCIIPHARGHVVSKPLAAIRQELASFISQGFQEIVLVGINLAAYGSDLGCDLCDAAALANEFSALKRLRLGSLEPLFLEDSALRRLSRVNALCPHFHVSLQSGCDSVLMQMNRPYSSSQYFQLVNRLRSLFPGCAITTDIIVGFPGESDADFEESLAFVREIGFAKVHVFPFSPRSGTPAADFPEQISKAILRARSTRMLSLANELHCSFLRRQTGKTLEVLLEEPGTTGGMLGYAPNYAHVLAADATPDDRNHIFPVFISDVNGKYCIGNIAH